MKKEYIACCCDGMMMHETYPLDETNACKAVLSFRLSGYFGFFFSEEEVRSIMTSKNGYLCVLVYNPLEKARPVFFKHFDESRMEKLLRNSEAEAMAILRVQNHVRVGAINVIK